MDLSFLRRAEQRFAQRAAARPDFPMLVAALRAQAASSPAAQAQASFARARAPRDAIAEILLGGPAWRDAVAAQGGSFRPELARKRGVN